MVLDLLRQEDARPMWLFYGVGREVNLVYADEFQRLAKKHENFHFVPVVSRALPSWTGERGWVQEPFLHEFKGGKDFDAYVCGIKVMVDDVVRLLKSEGLPEDRIYFEKYV
jgi:NAD(P)H-flavin reductase